MDETDQTSKEMKLPIEEKPLSKNQLKKLKKREKWLETKQMKRKAFKERKKQRLAEMREKGEDTGPNRKCLKSNTMKNSSCKIKVALDLSLEEYMSEKDITSLTGQIQHCYSANRRAENPLQLYACGLAGRTRQRLDKIGDYKGWDVHFKEDSYLEVFPRESIVYLSSESSNTLTSLSKDKVYIIGGLVDHNSHKGLCHRLAEENGIAHAQLPISEFLHMKGRRVLAVNHVFGILLRFTETGDWKQAFMEELPTRKGFAPVFDKDSQENVDTVKDEEKGSAEVFDDEDRDEENEKTLDKLSTDEISLVKDVKKASAEVLNEERDKKVEKTLHKTSTDENSKESS